MNELSILLLLFILLMNIRQIQNQRSFMDLIQRVERLEQEADEEPTPEIPCFKRTKEALDKLTIRK